MRRCPYGLYGRSNLTVTIPHVSDKDRQGHATSWLDAYPDSEAIKFAENANDIGAPSGLDQRAAETQVSNAEAAHPQYEYSRPFTFGGVPPTAPAPYTIRAPFNGPAEVCITSVTFAGTSLFGLITDADSVSVPSDTATLGNGQWSVIVAGNAISTIMGTDNWYPLAQETSLKLWVSGNGSGTKALWVNVQFRRRLTPVGTPYLGG